MSFFQFVIAISILLVATYKAINIAKEALRASKSNITTKFIGKDKSILLITAHPDDECMFFTPTILALKQMGIQVTLLCFTDGDYNGLGKIRMKELEASCKVLGIPVTIMKETRFKDGPDKWKALDVAILLDTFLKGRKDISVLLTFDNQGVSGHSNHCDLSKGVRYFAEHKDVEYDIIELKSQPLIAKYLGPIAIIYEYIQSFFDDNRIIAIPKGSYSYGIMAMKKHVSQMVWFRHLYLLFSSYMHINVLTFLRLVKEE